MSTLTVKFEAKAKDIHFAKGYMQVSLNDGRIIQVPLAYFPRLMNANSRQLNQWRLIGKGVGIHWEALDEDISVEGLLTSL